MDDDLKNFIDGKLRGLPSPSREDQAILILKLYVRTAEQPKPDEQWQELAFDQTLLGECVKGKGRGVVDEVLKSHNDGNYSYLQELTSKRPPSWTMVPAQSKEIEITENRSIINSIQRAFGGEFIGNTSFLKQHIRLLLDSKDLYSPSFAIIQSSGTGKSRLVQQLAAEYPTFLLCFRPPDSSTSISWPPTHDAIHKHFASYTSDDDKIRHIAALCFLKGLFDNAIEHLGKTPADWCKAFDNEQRRETFYETVLDAVQGVKGIKKNRVEPEDTISSVQHRLTGIIDDLIPKVQASLSALQCSLKPYIGPDIPVVVCFDEADGLKHCLPSFTSAFADLKDKNVVGIYLSTNSSVRQLAPATNLVTSERGVYAKRFGRPFTELPLDVFAHPTFSQVVLECLRLKDVRTIDATASLGRPMWWAQLNNQYPIPELLGLVSEKLAGTRDIIKGISDTGKLAVLACRLLIQCRPVSRTPVQDLVASHLGTAYFSNYERSELVIGYPPEPFVSAAAFKIMLQHEPTYQVHGPPQPATNQNSDVEMLDASKEGDLKKPPGTPSQRGAVWVDWLREVLRQDWISRGDRGELVSRVILTLARDQAYIENHGTPVESGRHLHKDTVLPGHEGVKLTTFIKKLVGDDAWKEIGKAKPVNRVDGGSLEDFIKNSVIDFTCFTATNDESIFTTDGMISALLQGAGVVCKLNQPTYDHVIPFLINEEKGIVKGNIGIIGEQAKNRAGITNPVIDPLSVLKEDRTVPVITIVSFHGHSTQPSSKPSPTRATPRESSANPSGTHYHLLVGMTPMISVGVQRELLETDSLLEQYKRSVTRSFGGSLVSDDVKKFATEATKIMQTKRVWGVSANATSNSFWKKGAPASE